MEILDSILEKQEFKKHEKIKEFSIKIYEDSDFEGLMELYESVFPGYMSKDLFLWKNNKNPFGNFITLLMKDNNKIISAYNMEPKEFYLYGKKVPCLQSLDTMTDSNYQGRGIISYLGKLSYEFAKELGYMFVFGFPNRIIYKLREKKLNWTIFGKIDLFLKEFNSNLQKLTLDDKYSIRKIKKFNEDIDSFWIKNKGQFPIIIKKDKMYLNWRFSEHPYVKYEKYYVLDNKNEELVAYFVLKRYQDKEGNNYGHIVDFMIGPQKQIIKEDLFKLIENFSINNFENDCSKITFWIPEETLKRFVLLKLKYNLIKMETYFGYKALISEEQLSSLKNFNNWYITMSNNDVF